MGTYQLENGVSPKGLKIGDLVVTQQGTYRVGGFKEDGSYDGKEHEPNVSMSNYTGQFGPLLNDSSFSSANKSSLSSLSSVHAGDESTVQNYGEGKLSIDSNGRITRTMDKTGQQFYVDPGDAKYQSIYDELMKNNHWGSDSSDVRISSGYQQADTGDWQDMIKEFMSLYQKQYQPVETSQYLGNVMTYQQALELADQLLTPKYDAMTQQAATAAAQGLEKSGLYDSLYGKALAQAQENAMRSAKQEAVNSLGIELVGQDRDWASKLLGYAIDENQFGYNYAQEGLSAAANLAMKMIDSVVQQTANSNDYYIKSQSLFLDRQKQALEAQVRAGELSQMDLENKLTELKIAAQELQNQAMRQELAGR